MGSPKKDQIRTELLSLVVDRLRRVEVTCDLSPVLEPAALGEAQQLANLPCFAEGDVDVRYSLGWFYWLRYLAFPGNNGQTARDTAISMLVPCLVFGFRRLPEALLPDLAESAAPLAAGLLERARVSSDLDTVARAVTVWKRVVRATPTDHPSHAVFQASLGIALELRFKNSGDLHDLDEATRAHRIATHLTPPDQSLRWKTLNNLADHLRYRFEYTGSTEYLNEAIQVGWKAIAIKTGNSEHLAGPLVNLSNALQVRFTRTGSSDDLDTAIELARRAVEVTSATHPEKSIAHVCVGTSLMARFERTEKRNDLSEAVAEFEKAIDATRANDPCLAGRLSNRGNALHARYQISGGENDLRKAVEDLHKVLTLVSTCNPRRGAYLVNLSAALLDYGKLTGQSSALDEAVRTAKEAVETTPVGHPNRPGYFIDLGNALHVRNDYLGDPADLAAAIRAYIDGAHDDGASPSLRIAAAHEAAKHLAEPNPHEAAILLESAVHQLPKLVSRHIKRGDQQRLLERTPALTSDAAALILAHASGTSNNRAIRALQVLESGRGVILGKTAEVREDLTELRRQHPDLAARFVDLRNQLDQRHDVSFEALFERCDLGIDTKDQSRLIVEFGKILAEIRTENGFASFGLPPSLDETLAAAAEGPVVIFNVSQHRSDALLITPGGVTSTPLPGLDIRSLIHKFDCFHQAVHASMHDGIDAVHAFESTLTKTLEWLWDVAVEPVMESLGFHDQPLPGESWPRVWWAPGGILGLLPIHAAGYHNKSTGDSTRRTVLDRVVSSYTPTIRALHHARKRASAATSPGNALIVAMPTTPGQSPLDHVRAEATQLRNRLPSSILLMEDSPEMNNAWDQELRPTRDHVLSQLPIFPIVHFACHAVTDAHDPSKSRLLLQDHNTTPLTVASLDSLNLDQAHLAYLSACSTSVVHAPELVDEAIHLTSAFQMAGYPHVIGTLWEINDKVAEQVSDAFYGNLIDERYDLGINRAALCLHHAVRAARDRLPNTPFLWAAYLHSGA